MVNLMEVDMVKLQHFFEADVRIKKDMYNVAFQSTNGYIGENSVLEYSNRLSDFLIYVFSELRCIVSDVFGINSSAFSDLEKMEESIKNKFYSCGLDMYKLKRFYIDCIANMDLSFIDLVKERCVGYKISDTNITSYSKTINEFLHYIHSYIVNNNKIIEAMPLINFKINNNKQDVSLRGYNSSYFESLFDNFPLDLDVGVTDMLIINERRMIMMIGDRGHALTTEITINGEEVWVEYFIPKICNVDMVNELPGINRVSEDSKTATGRFSTKKDELPNALFSFISKVPTDLDMVFPRVNM